MFFDMDDSRGYSPNLSRLQFTFLMLYLGLKRIYRIFEYLFEMIERIFVRLNEN